MENQNEVDPLSTQFKAAALAVTQLFKESQKQRSRAFEAGYLQCFQDLTEYILLSSSSSSSSTPIASSAAPPPASTVSTPHHNPHSHHHHHMTHLTHLTPQSSTSQHQTSPPQSSPNDPRRRQVTLEDMESFVRSKQEHFPATIMTALSSMLSRSTADETLAECPVVTDPPQVPQQQTPPNHQQHHQHHQRQQAPHPSLSSGFTFSLPFEPNRQRPPFQGMEGTTLDGYFQPPKFDEEAIQVHPDSFKRRWSPFAGGAQGNGDMSKPVDLHVHHVGFAEPAYKRTRWRKERDERMDE
ncbi:hypothetical protein BC829DRAFT_399610 [Chytridium lagenaria]|nr:hypothetical protein BC829DRAFT_399610 [Chytridium lagenaria]